MPPPTTVDLPGDGAYGWPCHSPLGSRGFHPRQAPRGQAQTKNHTGLRTRSGLSDESSHRFCVSNVSGGAPATDPRPHRSMLGGEGLRSEKCSLWITFFQFARVAGADPTPGYRAMDRRGKKRPGSARLIPAFGRKHTLADELFPRTRALDILAFTRGSSRAQLCDCAQFPVYRGTAVDTALTERWWAVSSLELGHHGLGSTSFPRLS